MFNGNVVMGGAATYRASWTNGVFVNTLAPGIAGMALDEMLDLFSR